MREIKKASRPRSVILQGEALVVYWGDISLVAAYQIFDKTLRVEHQQRQKTCLYHTLLPISSGECLQTAPA